MLHKSILTKVLIFGFLLSSMAQNRGDSIRIGGKKLNPQFSQNGQALALHDLEYLCEGIGEATTCLKQASTNHAVSNVLGVLSGAAIGFSLITVLSGEPSWVLAASGVGLFVVSIPFTSWYAMNARKGARIYNDQLASSAMEPDPVEWRLALSQNGVGLQVSF